MFLPLTQALPTKPASGKEKTLTTVSNSETIQFTLNKILLPLYQRVLEDFKPVMKTGVPELSLPPMDPLAVRDFKPIKSLYSKN